MKTFDLSPDELERARVAFFSLYPSGIPRWDVQQQWNGPAADSHRQTWAQCLKAKRGDRRDTLMAIKRLTSTFFQTSMRGKGAGRVMLDIEMLANRGLISEQASDAPPASRYPRSDEGTPD